jgi:hypothetical protein
LIVHKKLFALIACIAVSVPALAQQRELKPGFNLFSKEQDVQLGREAAAQIERQMPVVRNEDVTSFIQRIGKRLSSNPQAGGYPYTFGVIADKSINAFALPGGPTYVHTGLIAAAENEAQLAGVIAHEIAHVALRHGTNQASKANLIQLPAMLAGAVIGQGGSMLGQLAQLGIGLGANSVLLKFSRSAERDADLLGARLMSAAGYNPIEMARFFEKLEAQGGSQGPEFLSDHPNPGNRVKAVQEEIRYLPQRSYNADAGDLSRIQNLVGGINVPAQQRGRRSAATYPSDARPSGQFREYQSQSFSIAHPDNWQAFGEGNSVTIAPREGIVQNSAGQTAVGLGMMISYYFPQNNRIDLRRDTEDLIRGLRQSNPNLQVQNSRNTRVGGVSGLMTTMFSDSPFGQTEVDTLLTVPRPEGLFYVVFITPQREFENTKPIFERIIQSIRFSN